MKEGQCTIRRKRKGHEWRSKGGNTESAGEAYRLTYLVDAVRSISPAADIPATTVHGGDAAARQSYSDTRAAGSSADKPRSKWRPILTVRSSRLPPRADTFQADEFASRPLHMPERHNAYYTAAVAAIERTTSAFGARGKSASACQSKSNVDVEGGSIMQGCSVDADEDKEKAAIVDAIVAALSEQAALIPDSLERGGSVKMSEDVQNERLCRNALGEQSSWKAPLRPIFAAKGL